MYFILCQISNTIKKGSSNQMTAITENSNLISWQEIGVPFHPPMSSDLVIRNLTSGYEENDLP